ncbi:signal peptidase I [Candidatus Enterococcus clewellii]|uniref:Signal peptidase I n=1 Tax=Candidatus Enterococcus clewellii TaxID=1834193 RepID=A0A242K300_9ENTE|nr:signal peptidase I [Enterococcus sp. 9E7_DIV0242]OTP11654.1 signal peptidase I [Enterococcus sp. 9E7_DIV0242]
MNTKKKTMHQAEKSNGTAERMPKKRRKKKPLTTKKSMIKSKRRQSRVRKNRSNQLSNQPFFKKWNNGWKKIYSYREWLVLLLMICASIWLFITYTVHQVSGDSMAPTLANKERIVIRKTDRPNRYDIITFVPKDKQDENYVKRVIGIPGDAFYIQDNRLYLFPSGSEFSDIGELLYSNNLPDSTISFYLAEEVGKQLLGQNKIPEDAYFVVGDNRRNSTDSRAFAFIMRDQIEGVLSFRLYPFNSFGVVH